MLPHVDHDLRAGMCAVLCSACAEEQEVQLALACAGEVLQAEERCFAPSLQPHLAHPQALAAAALHRACGERVMPWVRQGALTLCAVKGRPCSGAAPLAQAVLSATLVLMQNPNTCTAGVSLEPASLEAVRGCLALDARLLHVVSQAQAALLKEASAAAGAQSGNAPAAAAMAPPNGQHLQGAAVSFSAGGGGGAQGTGEAVAQALRGFRRWELDRPVQAAMDKVGLLLAVVLCGGGPEGFSVSHTTATPRHARGASQHRAHRMSMGGAAVRVLLQPPAFARASSRCGAVGGDAVRVHVHVGGPAAGHRAVGRRQQHRRLRQGEGPPP